jgi:hypothetical protein
VNLLTARRTDPLQGFRLTDDRTVADDLVQTRHEIERLLDLASKLACIRGRAADAPTNDLDVGTIEVNVG